VEAGLIRIFIESRIMRQVCRDYTLKFNGLFKLLFLVITNVYKLFNLSNEFKQNP